MAKCGNCGHVHSKKCHQCKCDHPSAHPRPRPDLKRISDHMEAEGLSFREVGRRGQVDYTQVWRVCRGKSNPSYETLKGLAVGMGVTIEWMAEALGLRWER